MSFGAQSKDQQIWLLAVAEISPKTISNSAGTVFKQHAEVFQVQNSVTEKYLQQNVSYVFFLASCQMG